MSVLVTGGAGFVGRHLVRRLLADGRDVVVIDSFEEQVHGPDIPAAHELVAAGAVLFRAPVGDRTSIDAALAGVTDVVHLAALVGVGQSMYEIARYIGGNTADTAVLLEAIIARNTRIRRLVVASSMSIYGEGEYECAHSWSGSGDSHDGRASWPPRPEAQLLERQWELVCPTCGRDLQPVGTRETKPLLPTSVYAISKRDHEELCLVVGAAYGIPTVALRFFNIYGPGQALSNPYTGVAAIFGSRLLNQKPPLIFEDGQQSRDFIHVSDIVDGILLALESDAAVGHAINLGTGTPTTVNQIANQLATALEISIVPQYTGEYRVGDIRHCYADPTLAADLLGFHDHIPLDVGLTELAEWMRTQHADDHVDQARSELQLRGLAR